MAQAKSEPKPILPFLQPFYDAAIPLSWLVVRVAVGWNLLVHGWNKILTGPTDAFLKGFADLGFTPPAFGFGLRPASKRSVALRSFSACSPGFLPRLPQSRC
jgi:uncharacterized membrane protein YphA (DoxX/SURF4 family)